MVSYFAGPCLMNGLLCISSATWQHYDEQNHFELSGWLTWIIAKTRDMTLQPPGG
jgi:hypothetical protein